MFIILKEKTPGIYKITNTENGKMYIGSAVNLYARSRAHYYSLNKNTHHNKNLQHSWNNYGEDKFTIEVIEHIADLGVIIEREQHYINVYESASSKGYNAALIAGPGHFNTMRHSVESRKKISEYNTGKPCSPEKRAKISKSHTGKKLSEEHKRKISVSGATSFLGRKHSEESKKKISESKKGQGHPHTEESKAKISAALRGRIRPPCSDETRAKLSKAGKGRPHTEEHKRKISEAHRGKPKPRTPKTSDLT